jgi:hypothetical protein
MKAMGRVAAAVVSIALIPPAATAQPGRFNQCYELTVAQGYTNRAPGGAQFFYDCMYPGRRRAPEIPQAKGEVVCNGVGCRSVGKGCRLEYRTGAEGGPKPSGGNVEICK